MFTRYLGFSNRNNLQKCTSWKHFAWPKSEYLRGEKSVKLCSLYTVLFTTSLFSFILGLNLSRLKIKWTRIGLFSLFKSYIAELRDIIKDHQLSLLFLQKTEKRTLPFHCIMWPQKRKFQNNFLKSFPTLFGHLRIWKSSLEITLEKNLELSQ